MDNLFNTQTLLTFFGILTAIFALGVLVAVHEAGHLLMAKMCKIRVDVFAIGMGSALWKKTIGETVYQIGWIPFGGYCAFGEENEENINDPRSILNAPYWAKFLTIIGGSLFNMIFAFLMLITIFQIGYFDSRLANIIHVSPTIEQNQKNIASPAWEAGLRSGDQIIAINSKNIAYFNDIPVTLSLLDNAKETTVDYVRDQTTNTVILKPIQDPDTGLRILGVSTVRPTRIQNLEPNMPAVSTGLRTGDTIMSVNGKEISYAFQFKNIIEKMGKTEALNLQVRRDTDMLNFTLSPENIDGQWQTGIIFANPDIISVRIQSKYVGESLSKAVTELINLNNQMFISLKKLFTREINVRKNLSGPVRIISITGQVAQSLDIMFFLRFIVMLSVALAVFNMLPIPGLDGGALVLNGIRALGQKTPMSALIEKGVSFIERAGVIFLLVIASLVLLNDIINIRSERKAKTQQVQQEKTNP